MMNKTREDFNKDIQNLPINIPELNVYDSVDRIISAIKMDLREADRFEDTFIYKVFQDSAADSYRFSDQMRNVFSRPKKDTNHLAVRLFFDAKRAEIPTIHINLPNEQSGEDGLGVDEGFCAPIFYDEKMEYARQYSRRFKSNYQVLITSSNSLECIGIYHLLRAAFISQKGALEFKGLENLGFSGGDLQINPEIMPAGVFMRGFNLSFSYQVTAPAINNEKFYKALFVDSKILRSEELP